MRVTLSVPVQQPITPIVELDFRYLVVRGDGQARLFEHLGVAHHQNTNTDYWCPIGSKTLQNNWVLIPLDMLTAYNLGLCPVEELMLPDHIQAILHVFKHNAPNAA